MKLPLEVYKDIDKNNPNYTKFCNLVNSGKTNLADKVREKIIEAWKTRSGMKARRAEEEEGIDIDVMVGDSQVEVTSNDDPITYYDIAKPALPNNRRGRQNDKPDNTPFPT